MKKSEEIKIRAEIIAMFEGFIQDIMDYSAADNTYFLGDAMIRPENAEHAVAIIQKIMDKCL